MWCKDCRRETNEAVCEFCGRQTTADIPAEIYRCPSCNTPIIRYPVDIDRHRCPVCSGKAVYMASDMRPMFPEERLLLEILLDKPMEFHKKSVWANTNKYYIDGETINISKKHYNKYSPEYIISKLDEYKSQNTYEYFDQHISKFIEANKLRLNYIIDEAHSFIQKEAEKYPRENIVLSFSGGKDSTVTADLAAKALSDPSMVHIFGNTTLEFPLTLEYAARFRENNPKAIFRTAQNKEQDFYSVCEDIGPPARMMRWCCSMFKTGPITRILNRYYKDINILTFYGIRKCESVSRSKYNRVEDNAESVKIQKQKVASPIFLWQDLDILRSFKTITTLTSFPFTSINIYFRIRFANFLCKIDKEVMPLLILFRHIN